MSILTIITVSQFGMAQKRSRDVARKADLNSLSKALLNYYADHGVFPSDITWDGEFKDDTNYIYMKVVPTENRQSSAIDQYCYVVGGDDPLMPDKFALFSDLENEEDGEYNKYNNDNDYVPDDCSPRSYNFIIVSPNAEYGNFK